MAGGSEQDREKPGGRLGQITQSSARGVQCLGPFPSAVEPLEALSSNFVTHEEDTPEQGTL